jgi:tetratricopeptide (TPR) repeat protein
MLKILQKISNIKKVFFLIIMVLGLLFFNNANAEERESELNNLFKQLKNSEATKAIEIENKIWKIWSIHPFNDRRGFRLTELLDQGSLLTDRRELNKAYEIFTQIIATDPNWSEAWNKRALVLYLMKQYQSSLDDIKITLALEPRHFGALSGQALNYIELKQYEKAIKSYKAAQKVYPAMGAAKKMIPQLQELIKDQAV